MGAAKTKNELCHAIDLNNPDELILILRENTQLVNSVIKEDCRHAPLHRAI